MKCTSYTKKVTTASPGITRSKTVERRPEKSNFYLYWNGPTKQAI